MPAVTVPPRIPAKITIFRGRVLIHLGNTFDMGRREDGWSVALTARQTESGRRGTARGSGRGRIADTPLDVGTAAEAAFGRMIAAPNAPRIRARKLFLVWVSVTDGRSEERKNETEWVL
jgi:hypothetical protein